MKLKLINGPVFYATIIIIVFAFIGCGDKPSQPTAVTQNTTAPAKNGINPSSDGSQTAEDAFREGTSFGKRGQYEKAMQAYSKAIELNPEYTKAYTFRGFTHLKLGNFADAIKDMDKVIALDPTADSYRTRADVYARTGYLDKAIMDYDKELELNPRSASGYCNRAIAYGKKKTTRKRSGISQGRFSSSPKIHSAGLTARFLKRIAVTMMLQ